MHALRLAARRVVAAPTSAIPRTLAGRAAAMSTDAAAAAAPAAPAAAATETPAAPAASPIAGTGYGAFSTPATQTLFDTRSTRSSYRPQGQQGELYGGDAALSYATGGLEQPKPSVMHVKATFNNTLVTITNPNGDALASSSGGQAGFKKANRAGYEPAYQATKLALEKLEAKLGDSAKINGLHVKFSGFGPGRDAAWKCIGALGWPVNVVEDVTPIAHGGCRPRKARRL
ncbi:hypothetical protein H9P43_002064 [Blastocladiella emersonii ATCC 22665]|nr:hypothetical protein H9P43_002064 [Blastocladiella emersonii ATCC 22665]